MRNIFYYVTYTEKLARAKKLMSGRHEQRRSYPTRKSFLPISGIEHNERLYWWRRIISMSVRIVCQNRNMIVYVKDRMLWWRLKSNKSHWDFTCSIDFARTGWGLVRYLFPFIPVAVGQFLLYWFYTPYFAEYLYVWDRVVDCNKALCD